MRGFLISVLMILLFTACGQAQCQVYDGQGNPSANPVWVSCTGGAFTLFVQSPNNFGALTIDWGDGSPTTNVASLITPNFISHAYAATIANYTVTITEASTGCVITGLVVMEEPVNASIQIPVGGVTQTCAPDILSFTNSSTDVSANTTFIWNFGDGSPTQTYNSTNAGQTVTHSYLQGTVNCVTQVTLSAQNYCSFGNPTVASFNPIQIYDLDDAAITASNTLLCYPDTVVHFANTTSKNCVPQGNTAQRFEYWNFGNYWGTGSDSIIDWTPFDPPAKPGYNIAFPGLGTYTVMMADSNMCGKDTAFITVQIVDAPIAGLSASVDSACSGTPITFTNLSSGGNQSLIRFGDGGGFSAFGATATHAYNAAGTYTVTVVANIVGGSNACTDTATLSVLILTSPNAQASITGTGGCDSVVAAFNNTSTGGATYLWNFGGSTSTLQNPPSLTYTTTGIHTVTLTVTGSNTCTDMTTASVTVYDVPQVNFSAANVCEDAIATFFDASTVGYGGPVNSWQWHFGDAFNTTSTLQNPTFTYTDSGAYIVTLIAATNFCSDTIVDTLQVEPRPIAAFTESDSLGCSPLSVTFTDNSLYGASVLWNFGDGSLSSSANPTHIFTHNALSDTFFVVTLYVTTAFGCEDSVSDTIFVKGNPVADFTSDAVLDCAPLEVQFSDSSVGALAIQWAFGDGNGSTLANPLHVFQNQTQFITNYTVTLTATAPNGCTDSAFQTITVYPEPLFNFSIVPDSGCAPLSVQFPVAVGAVIYNWDFGDGGTSTGPNPTHVFNNTTTNNALYAVQLVATSPFGCVDTVNGSVKVFPKPTAILSPAVTQGCEPLQVTFVNGSTGGTQYNWDFDDGSSSTSGSATITHSYPNATNDTLFFFPRLIAVTDKGCSDTAQVEVRPFRRITADFSALASGCHPLPAVFTDLSLNANSWSWTFGDGNSSTQPSPSHTYQNLGTAPVNYTAQLIVQSVEGCQDSKSQVVTVNHKPNAQFLPLNVSGCEPLTVNFANNSTSASSYSWNFGDNTFSTAGGAQQKVYTNAGNTPLNYQPQLIVSTPQGCTDTATGNVTVYRRVLASFVPPQPGCHPFTATFTDQSVNAVNWQWSFGDGAISGLPSPTHQYTNSTQAPLTFNVDLIVTNADGCSHDTTIVVQVNPKPISSFAIDDSPACNGEQVLLQNNSTSNDQNYWRFGASGLPVVNNAPVIDTLFFNLSPTTPRDFQIYLVVENTYGCRDTSAQSMRVYPPITASFASLTEGCSPLELTFTNLSSGGNLFAWDFDDGQQSVLQNPTHVFENSTNADIIYSVRLKAISPYGCESFDTLDILVHPTPAPAFTANPLTQVFPDSVVVLDNVTPAGPWTYEWSFGDGEQSVMAEPGSHSYPTWGTYRILLEASTEYCSDTTSRSIVIEPPLPVALFQVDVDACAPVTVRFVNESWYGEFFLWEFGDGASSTSRDPVYTYQFPGTYSVRLTVTGYGGDRDVMELLAAVVVRPQPVANFVFSPSEVNVPTEAVTFINYSQFADNYFWDFGDSATSEVENPQHQYTRGGQFFPSLIASTNFGCADTFLAIVPVVALEKGAIQVPNAFTPNLQGSPGSIYDPRSYDNQVFFPVITGAVEENYRLSIFNRWGELLFETRNIYEGWDGYYRGVPCQQDVYVWKVSGEYVTGEKFNKVGDVSLIR